MSKAALLFCAAVVLVGCGGSGGGAPRQDFLFDGQASARQLTADIREDVHDMFPLDDGRTIVTSNEPLNPARSTMVSRFTPTSGPDLLGFFQGTAVRVLNDGSSLLIQGPAPTYGLSIFRNGTVTPLAGAPTGVQLASVASNADASVVAARMVGGSGSAILIRGGAMVEIPGSSDFSPVVVHADGVRVAGNASSGATIWTGSTFQALPIPAGRANAWVACGSDDFHILAGHSRLNQADSQQTLTWIDRVASPPFDDGQIEFISADGTILAGYSWEQYRYAAVWDAGRAQHPIVPLVQSWLPNQLPALGHHRTVGLSPTGRYVAVDSPSGGTWHFRLP